jgi:aryl-alcohol dehydrogenase-like predicted oxidoreductase
MNRVSAPAWLRFSPHPKPMAASYQGIVPLTGTQSLEHMREDLACFELELSEAERAQITALL